MKKPFSVILTVILTVLIMYIDIFVPCAALIHDDGLFFRAFEKTGAEENTGIGMGDLRKVHVLTVSYIRGEEDGLEIVCERYDGPIEFYKKDEKAHLTDVRDLWKKASEIFIPVIAVASLIIFFGLKGTRGVRPRMIRVSSASALILPAFFALFFDRAFDLFHMILFPQGNWIFYPDISLMINLYSEGVFVRCAVFTAALALLINLALYTAAVAADKKRK